MKTMDFPVWLGERRRHSRSYDNDEQQRQAGKDAFSCFFISESQYPPTVRGGMPRRKSLRRKIAP